MHKTNLLSGILQSDYEYRDYSSVITLHKNEDKILIDEVCGFSELLDFIISNETISKRLWYEGNIEKDRNRIALFLIIGDIVDRYISIYGGTEYSIEKFNSIYDEVTNIYFLKQLEFDICIPILMIEFESDNIEISDVISIEKMPLEFIRSKANIGNYDSHFENIVINCATHMIVIKGYTLENKSFRSTEIFENKSAYPIQVIDAIFASIRTISKYSTGYAQFVCRPQNNWINRNCKGDLMGLTGAKAKEFPEEFIDFSWLKQHLIIKKDLEAHIVDLANRLIDNSNNVLDLAIKRLNRSVLRDNEEDTILDAIIGLELLLSDNDKGELTYKISSRMATISTLIDDFPYTPMQVQKSMSQIYRYRSDIVHSRKIRPATKLIIIDDKTEITPIVLAIDYLRYAINILAHNPEYLNSKNIDKLMMERIHEGLNKS